MLTAGAAKYPQKCVLDASVAVKWFSQEEGTARAEEFLSRAFSGSMEIYAPDLLVYEIANALFKGKRLNQEKISAALEMVYNSPLQLFPPDKLMVVAGVRFMVKYNLTFYDASYAALAHVLQVPLVSANAKDHKKVPEIEILEF